MADYKDIPDDVKSDILNFLNTISGTRSLSHQTIEWAKAHKLLQSSTDRKLYRGLFFSKKTPDDKDPALQFLRGSGVGDTIRLRSPNFSSWTSIRGMARSFSMNSNQSTYWGARKLFLKNEDPELNPTGVVISSIIPASNIILNVERLSRWYNIQGDYGREWEYIVSPMPSLSAEIEMIYTFGYVKTHYSSLI